MKFENKSNFLNPRILKNFFKPNYKINPQLHCAVAQRTGLDVAGVEGQPQGQLGGGELALSLPYHLLGQLHRRVLAAAVGLDASH